MPKLLDKLRLALCTRRYSIRTEQAYVAWAWDLIRRSRVRREAGEMLLVLRNGVRIIASPPKVLTTHCSLPTGG